MAYNYYCNYNFRPKVYPDYCVRSGEPVSYTLLTSGSLPWLMHWARLSLDIAMFMFSVYVLSSVRKYEISKKCPSEAGWPITCYVFFEVFNEINQMMPQTTIEVIS